jgi:GNAT superfamily N-acetyltransferase
VSVRPATSADAGTHVYPPERFPFPSAAVRDRWHRFTEAGGWAMLSPDGFAAVEEPWLEALYVRPGAWGTGLAVVLHDLAVAERRARGVSEARLWVLERNARARRFYERLGWRADGTTRVVEFPPNPIDVGYTLELASAAAGAGGAPDERQRAANP